LIVAEVLTQGHSLTACAPDHLASLRDPRDRALAHELAYGGLRWWTQLQFLLGTLLKQPLKPKDSDIQALLLVGLYQLMHLRIPSHAAVAATVAASRLLNKGWAAALINAVLRNFLRKREQLTHAVEASVEASHAHPRWILEALRQAWPEQWRDIVAQNNRRPPMFLRVNALKSTREDYLLRLSEAGIKAEAAPFTSHGIRLTKPQDVTRLPGFAEGEASVQDAAAQLAAPLLDVQTGQRVLDACAAPGGKTAHLFETCPGLGQLIAVEKDAGRMGALRDTLQRLQIKAETILADAGDLSAWWDGQAFDRILLDAPCSGSGVIRRHPDLKCLKRASDIPQLAAAQLRLLEALWPLLGKGGKLLYVTCSVFPSENQEPIQQFLNQRHDAERLPIPAPWGHETPAGRQVLPGAADMDGFFFALLAKR
jgi:16S rRNA (cytosine967-C5)-methyltransferase